MSELLFNNVQLTRSYFLKNVSALDDGLVDVQPDGFNNTLHWHIGHVLTVAEQLMFGFPENTNNLPVNYKELFARGTKPADWQGQVPSVKELVEKLTDQLTRMNDIPVESINKKLESPFLGCKTFGELVNFCLFHENLHLGQIQAMKRMIETAQAK
ncbi:DinB family protein [Neobacillus sp. FSL H8-0543]|uniref:DinB family protein n=1 Tax=Neobacillus sp. FSL H8-0543 TaxID=2954672 RepID=UPI003158337B